MSGDVSSQLPPPALAWAALDDQVLLEAALRTGPAGLTEREVGHRFQLHVPNELPPVRLDTWWKVLARQFAGPLIFVLVVAGSITIVQREWVDATAIFTVIVLNATLGF